MLNGDLKLFNQVIDKFKEKFLSEKTYTLIIRLMSITGMLFTENPFILIRLFNYIDFQVAPQCDQGWSSDD